MIKYADKRVIVEPLDGRNVWPVGTGADFSHHMIIKVARRKRTSSTGGGPSWLRAEQMTECVLRDDAEVVIGVYLDSPGR